MFKRLGGALIVGLVAATAVWLSGVASLPSWLIFLSWVSYFIFGPGVRRAAWATLHILLGLVLGLVILRLNAALAPHFGQWALVGLVLVAAMLLTLLERARAMNNIPAYYIGAIGMFAAGVPPNIAELAPLYLAVALGFGFGWLTIAARHRVERIHDANVGGISD